MLKPYYEDTKNGLTIYCGDCLEVMKELPDKSVDLVLTDPPYPDYHKELFNYKRGILDPLKKLACKQLIFWSAKADFPLDYTAIHIWDKKCGVGSMYERIFEINGQLNYKVYRHYLINSTVAAKYGQDIFNEHPSQKPIKLIRELLLEHKAASVLDPFLGSGTTLVACKELGRKGIGIEISEKYCEIAVKRLKNTQVSMF